VRAFTTAAVRTHCHNWQLKEAISPFRLVTKNMKCTKVADYVSKTLRNSTKKWLISESAVLKI